MSNARDNAVRHALTLADRNSSSYGVIYTDADLVRMAETIHQYILNGTVPPK